MRVATAIERVIMGESMKRSHWHRLKSTSRWFWHWEGETENHFTAKDTWPWGKNANVVALGSMLWPKRVKGQTAQSLLSLDLDNDWASSIRLYRSHADMDDLRHKWWANTHTSQPNFSLVSLLQALKNAKWNPFPLFSSHLLFIQAQPFPDFSNPG